MSHSLLLLCGIPIWGMKGVQLDYNIFPSREIIVTSLTYLALDGWKDLSVSLFLERVVSACFFFFGKFCLSVLPGMFVSPVYSWS